GPGAAQASALTWTGLALLAVSAAGWLLMARRRGRRWTRSGVLLMLVALVASGCFGGGGRPTGPPGGLTIYSRAHWGANESLRRCPPEYAPSVRYAVVHHTGGGPGDNNYSDGAAKVRSIYLYHTQVNGWCDIGYNFLIDKWGTIWEGRYGGLEAPVIGAHAAPFNTEGTGVAIMGDFTNQNAPPAAQDALVRLLAWKLTIHHIDPYAPVSKNGRWISAVNGHRDVAQTACPGNSFYPSLFGLGPEIARRVFYGPPIGHIDALQRAPGGVHLRGWTLDPDAYEPIWLHVYVGGVRWSVYADVPRTDIAAIYPRWGARHGFDTVAPAPGGPVQVCIYALNVSHGGPTLLGCRTV
ncbi:MAG: N-acetylmuramoyl-L-alanine amidase, partial [Acidimicrobiia bacterium]